MKARPLQFGARENTASSRQHAPRHVCGLSLPESQKLTVNQQVETQSAQQPAALVETSRVPLTEPSKGPTGGNEPSPNNRQRRKRYGDEESLLGPPVTAKGLVGIHEATQFLAVSVSTLYGWVWQRRIPFIKVGRAVRFDRSDLQGFVEANRIHARPARKR